MPRGGEEGRGNPEKKNREKKGSPQKKEGQRNKADEDAEESGSTGSAESVATQLARKMAELTL